MDKMSDFSNSSSGNFNSSCPINNTMAILFNASVYNTTNCTNSSGAPLQGRGDPPANPWAIFHEVSYYSSFVIIVIAFITFLANALLLIVFVLDPLKTFRTPTSLFLISLALADMVTSTTTEPFLATCFLMFHYSYPNVTNICNPLFDASQRISNVSMNISYFTVLELTVIQFIVIKSPLKYGRKITRKKVAICILLTWVYCIAYNCLFFTEDQNIHVILSKVDLFFRSILMIITMSLFYVLLYHEFHRKMARGASLRNASSSTKHIKEINKTSRLQKKFVSLNFFLILLLYMCTIPSVVVWLLLHYRFHGQVTPKLLIAQLMADIMLYLKFLLDPIIYAWRLPQYREALVFMVKGRNPRNGVVRSSMTSVSNATMATICDGNDSIGNASLPHFEQKRKNYSDQKDEKRAVPPAYSSKHTTGNTAVTRPASICSEQANAVTGTQLNRAAPPPYHQQNMESQTHDTRL